MLVTAAGATAAIGAAGAVPSALAAVPASDTEPGEPAAETTANPFLPDDEDVNVTDCISAAPRPGCGSDERGGWRQWAVFGVLAAALVVVGMRIVVGIRRRAPQGDER